MQNLPPRQQGTVVASTSTGTWVIFAVIAALLAAWLVKAFVLDARLTDQAVVDTPAPASSAATQASPTATSETLPPLATAPEAGVVARHDLPQIAAPPSPPPTARPGSVDACDAAIARTGMQLPADFRLFAAGAYGGRELGFQIDQSGHTATQIDVVVNSQDKPVALMLGAYEPTVWNVSWTPGTRIVAVYAGGYHRQRVAGLQQGVPLLVSSYEDRKQSGCPYFYLGGEGLQTVNPAARRVFGRPVDLVYPAGKDGTVFVGGAGPVRGIERSSETTVASFRDASAPLAGQPGIEDAINRGKLRRASASDAALWSRALAQSGRGSYDTPPVAGQTGPGQQPLPPPRNVYIVTGDMTFPAGLYGAHSVTFVVPPGVSRPRGDPGHSMVYEVR